MATTKHLQISVDTHVPLLDDAHITPVDMAVPNDFAAEAQTVISLSDLTDAVPGDGKYEVDKVVKTKIKIFGMTFNVSLPIRVTLAIVDHA